jgi:hypothetical protein
MTDLNPRPVPLEQTRQRIVEQLCDQYAAENLTDTGLEERLTKAYAATTVVALQELVADLPTEAPGTSAALATARPELVSERQVILAVMGGAERKGAWTPPKHLHVVTVMGGAHLDFRSARFSPGVTDLTCFVLMGGVEIVVPPGVHVELNGFALMGGFAQSGRDLPADPNAPVLRIGGVAVMGGVDLQVRHAGESAGDVRAAERLARKEAKRLRRGE